MRIETTRKLFTVDEYYKMADGILTPEDRVELIDGEIVPLRADRSVNPLYYPGTQTLSAATLIEVGEGEHVEGLQFTVF